MWSEYKGTEFSCTIALMHIHCIHLGWLVVSVCIISVYIHTHTCTHIHTFIYILYIITTPNPTLCLERASTTEA